MQAIDPSKYNFSESQIKGMMVSLLFFSVGRENEAGDVKEDPNIGRFWDKSDEMLNESDLPLKYCAMSTCFRREAGAAGKDTTGLYRIHLFDKVEQVIVCRNDKDESKRWHQDILKNAEDVLLALGLPYRVVNVCTGDLGMGQVQKFDIETWMPSRNAYGETHSASRFYEFQSRRLKLRYRDGAKKVHFCHTLNNTVIASPRALIPVLELYQNRDGTVTIPQALRPYMAGRERIENG